jgi:hypothetical protein
MKTKGLGIRKAARASEDPWNGFEDKDSYTTSEIAHAVLRHIAHDMGMSVNSSSPIPLIVDEKIHLCFFLFTITGTNKNLFLKPPFCRIISPIYTYKEIQFMNAEPKDFNINVPSGTSLVNLNVSPRFRPYKGNSSKESNFLTWRDPLYELIDKILLLYPRDQEQLSDNEKASVQEYLEMFSCLIEPSFLPAYRSLNPHFFDWLESVIGEKIDSLLTI